MQTVARGEFPALREQLRVHQHRWIFAGLVAREGLGQLALGRLARDAFGFDAHRAERLGDVVGVAHAGRVSDAGTPLKHRLVDQAIAVERRLVQQLRQQLLVELDIDLALRSGTFAIVRTPGPGGIRMQRSSAIAPRRAACARSTQVCVGTGR